MSVGKGTGLQVRKTSQKIRGTDTAEVIVERDVNKNKLAILDLLAKIYNVVLQYVSFTLSRGCFAKSVIE
jgi:hypothetical protein